MNLSGCYIISLFLLTVNNIGGDSLFPEDAMTDSNEELARFKRESFVQSILKHFPFFKHSFDSSDSDKERVSDKDSDSEDQDTSASSTVSSDSSQDSSPQEISTLSSITNSNAERTSSTLNPTPMATITPSLQENIIKTPSIGLTNSTMRVNGSIKMEINETSSWKSVISSSSFMASNTTPFDGSSISEIVQSSPDTPLASTVAVNYSTAIDSTSIPYFPSVDTLSSTNIALSSDLNQTGIGYSRFGRSSSIPVVTVASVDVTVNGELESIDLFNKTSAPSMIEQSSLLLSYIDVVSQGHSLAEDSNYAGIISSSSSQMSQTLISETAPDGETTTDQDILNKRFRIPVILGNGDDKNVRFVYTNIIIPIISGIMGAMLITFGIMMFRCCRRRKLKKVRYFGGKASSDLVRLDRMNLLSESSDDEYYD